jgi:hypothetical protein
MANQSTDEPGTAKAFGQCRFLQKINSMKVASRFFGGGV